MENLAAMVFQRFFPSLYNLSQIAPVQPDFNRAPQRPRHDPKQRKGKMSAPHAFDQCEACQQGWCFPANM